MQQALHKRAARLKKAGHRVARKQQELMHVVHVSTDLRKVSWGYGAGLLCMLYMLDLSSHILHELPHKHSWTQIAYPGSQVYIGDEYDTTRNGTR